MSIFVSCPASPLNPVHCRWGVGCVFFEIVSLFPLFPGTNELDQIQKIHNILGTPPPELLAKMKKRSQHMDFNFPPKEGSGIPKGRADECKRVGHCDIMVPPILICVPCSSSPMSPLTAST